mmetsp:Transcript_25600/g.53182  ORF Transcript_25600/g.53182 Transcript_25600/m.53182 type:complete len:110 (-) Transcript_25600:69-398(-)
MKQQARLDAEAREKAERSLAAKKRKGSSSTSLKAQARASAEAARSREVQEAAAVKEELRRKIEADREVRKNDPNWRPKAAGDKSQGSTKQTTFRDKFGEDGGCGGGGCC